MRLEDDPIVLRPFTEDDVPAITLACQDPEIPRWTSIPSPYTEEDARAFVRGAEGVFDFAVVSAATDQLLGSVGFGLEGHARAGFGYWTRKEARGRGVASRALRLLVRWAAGEHGLARMQLIVEPANAASIRVAENAGSGGRRFCARTSSSRAPVATSICTPCSPRTYESHARPGATPGHHPRLTLTPNNARVARALCRFGAKPK